MREESSPRRQVFGENGGSATTREVNGPAEPEENIEDYEDED